MPSKISKKEFLLRLREVHSGTIKRLKIPEYTKSDAKHRVRCTECGHVWTASGYTLTSKNPNGCPECAKLKRSKQLTTSLDDFCKQLKSIHGKRIHYVDGYKKVGEKATFKCAICSHIWKTKCISLVKTNNHGCPQCARKTNSLKRVKTTSQFKQEMFACHGATISVLDEYKGCKDKIKVKCNTCSFVWEPMPDTLVGANPHGCPQCKAKYLGMLSTKPKQEFEKQLYTRHGSKIRLISDYQKQTSLLQFQCHKGHKWWTNQAYALVASDPSGCPQCANVISKGESELFQFIRQYAPDAQQSVRKTRDSKTGGLLEWDIFIPSKNIAIEYNGVYFHAFPKKSKDYHSTKSKLSSDQHNVRVIHISDIEWSNNKKVVQKTLKHILGVSDERYYARNLTIVERNTLTPKYRSFYNKNHLQGSPTSGVSFALLDKEHKIKAVMTFISIQSVRGTKREHGNWELIRFASKGSVVGGATKLFTAFLRKYNPVKILSYSQNDWFDGSLYKVLGFSKIKDCKYDYRTVWDNKLRHKSYTRRKNLQKLLGSNFDPAETEQQNLINNNIPILYDSGKIKWEWKR